ncbi:MAG: type VII toxin-antitoxin system HepT family RNase toxin, partial [Gammaproteobacteria bacterium]
QTMGASFDELARMAVLDTETADSLKKAVGFRNVAVHNYDDINWEIVMSICRDKLPDFKRFAELVVLAEGE